MAIISFITDFGTRDEYVGLMKAVILGIDPAAVIVDVSHSIEPQDVAQAAFMVESACRHFPDGSLHLVVVDPGVGADRAILYLEADRQRFLAPDNGVLSLVMAPGREVRLRRVEATRWQRPVVSPTFHGRDIMAPAAGHLSGGMDARELGPETDAAGVVHLDGLRAGPGADGALLGRVIHVDRFGNLITNIDAMAVQQLETIQRGRSLSVAVGGHAITGIVRTYADAEAGRPLALIGSRGYLEVAVNAGSAQELINARRGDPVRVSGHDDGN
jgi:S-adenosyl-L-methionine hydrolase (adenosine-forming)